MALAIACETAAVQEAPCTLTEATPQDGPEGAVQHTMRCDDGSGPRPNSVVFRFDADGDPVIRNGDLEDRFGACVWPEACARAGRRAEEMPAGWYQ